MERFKRFKLKLKVLTRPKVILIVLIILALAGVVHLFTRPNHIAHAANAYTQLGTINLAGQSFTEEACITGSSGGEDIVSSVINVNTQDGPDTTPLYNTTALSQVEGTTTDHDNWITGSTSVISFDISGYPQDSFDLGIESGTDATSAVYGTSHTVSAIAKCSSAVIEADATTSGWVHVNGTQIIDSNGNPIYFSGIDDASMDPGQGPGEVLSADGKVQIVGLGTVDSVCKKYWTPIPDSEINEIRDAGMNTIRIAVTWSNLEPIAPTYDAATGTYTHTWNTAYVQQLESAINYIQSKGMMVILDMHQSTWSPAFSGGSTGAGQSHNLCDGDGMPTWLYPDNNPHRSGGISIGTAKTDFFDDISADPSNKNLELPQEGFEAAWHYLASQFASNPTVVGADMFNEPIGADNVGYPKSDLSTFYTTVGDDIRSVDPNIMLIYEDDAYQTYVNSCSSSSGCEFELQAKPNLTNAIYSWHYYPTSGWNSTTQAQLQTHVNRAKSWNVPLWIGENDAFGIMDCTTDNNACSATLNSTQCNDSSALNAPDDLSCMLQYFKSNGVSWTLWAYNADSYQFIFPGSSPPEPKTLLQSILPKYNYSPATAASITLRSISPTSGPVTGGTSFTIAGTNFAKGDTVYLGSTQATVSSVTSTSITATAPASTAAGPANVTVSSGSEEGIMHGGFTYNNVPTTPRILGKSSITPVPGGYEVAYVSNTGQLVTVGTDGSKNWGLGMYPGSSPSITSVSGGYEVAAESSAKYLWTVGTDGSKNWGLGMYPGSSPSITSVSGGYEVAAESSAKYLWTVGNAGDQKWQYGMYAGSSPSIVSGIGGYEVAFEANTAQLWTVGTDGNKNWGYGMYSGSSPSITSVSGGYEVAFESNVGQLWTVGHAGNKNWNYGTYLGSSPSITTGVGYGASGENYEVAFESNVGQLWTVGTYGNENWEVSIYAGSSPSITSVSGGYEVAFEANTGLFWTVGHGGNTWYTP